MSVRVVAVDVVFKGQMTVDVPEHLSEADGILLAEKKALAKILATTDNPDCGEALVAASEDFEAEAEAGTEADFDAAIAQNPSGRWSALRAVKPLEAGQQIRLFHGGTPIYFDSFPEAEKYLSDNAGEDEIELIAVIDMEDKIVRELGCTWSAALDDLTGCE